MREIKNVAETVVIGADGKRQGIDEILHALIQSGYEGLAARARAYGGKLADPCFLAAFLRTLEETKGNVTVTARRMRISRSSAYNDLEALKSRHPPANDGA